MNAKRSITISESKVFGLEGCDAGIDRYTKAQAGWATSSGELITKRVNFFRMLDPAVPPQTGYGNKDALKYLCDNYGSKLWEKWDKLMYREWVVPVKDYYRLFTQFYRGGYRIERHHLEDVYTAQEKGLIDQAIIDNQDHMLPFIVYQGQPAQELRQAFGKGIWKKLCKNSFSRNLLIAQGLHKTGLLHYIEGDWLNKDLDKCVQDIKTFISLPSTVLKTTPLERSGIVSKMLQEGARCKDINRREIQKVYHGTLDAERMIRQIKGMGVKWVDFNPDWSLKRIKEEHDKASAQLKVKNASDVVYPSLALWEELFTIRDNNTGYTAHMLKTHKELQQEGTEMRHCIGGYGSEVAAGHYLMFSIRDRLNSRVSSLQIHTRTGQIGQHYGYGNSEVRRLEANTLAAKISLMVGERINVANSGPKQLVPLNPRLDHRGLQIVLDDVRFANINLVERMI